MKKEEITQIIGGFYNRHPFPGFELEAYTNKEDLYYDANVYGKMLADQIPQRVSIIDFGCGTGRHSCLLGIKNRKVLGIDISEKSLRISNNLKKKLKLNNVTLKKQDIFNLSLNFKADYILSIGVLHHTHSIEKAFEQIIMHLKPNGYVIIGLYNTYGRLITKALRLVNRLSFYGVEKLDFYIHNIARSEIESEGWRYDMYRCPYELTTTIGRVLNMFKKNNIRYVNSFPDKFALNEEEFPKECEQLFSPKREGRWWEHAYIQFKWVFSKYKAGGLFMVIGQKLQ